MLPRIAVIFEYASLNGGEESMLSVLSRGHGREFECIAVCPSAGPLANRLDAIGIPRHAVELHDPAGRRLPAAVCCERLRVVLARLRPNLVHANSLSMGRLTGQLAATLDVPTSCHLRDILKLSGKATADLNGNAAMVAVSQATSQFHIAQGLDESRVRVIYNGVDTERFAPRPAPAELRRELGVEPAATLMLSVGQICLRKGQDVLAEAAAQLAVAGVHLHWVLVGQRHSTKTESVHFEADIGRRFRQARIEDRLHNLGYRRDVDRLMNECDILVHAARQEPFGRVLLEAASSGLPIVATHVGGTAELLRDGHSARLVAPGSARELTDAVADLVARAPLRAKLADEARKTVAARFTLESATHQLAQFWHGLIG